MDSQEKILSHPLAKIVKSEIKMESFSTVAEERSHEFFLTKTWKI